VIVAIQVFQHGDRDEAHRHIREAQRRVTPGGLLCVRVNAVGTDLYPRHEIVERTDDGSLTIRYLEGAKTGLDVHFFSEEELAGLFAEFETVLPLRADVTSRTPPQPGQWTQWEAIWRRAA